MTNISSQTPKHAEFATTCWSVVLTAGRNSDPDVQTALASLCEIYWYPLYAFARRRGRKSHDARDLTQGFFAVLLEKEYLKIADRQKGRFRSFLLKAFQRFLSKEQDRRLALKRGGGDVILSINSDDAEARYRAEPQDEQTPEKLYERRWALTLLNRVLEALQKSYEERGQQEFFDCCREYLLGSGGTPSYAETAERLGLSESAVKVGVHRLRQRYREQLLEEVSRTVESSEDVNDEIRNLLTAVRGS